MQACPLLALSGHARVHCTCPLLGVKRTCLLHCDMSAFDPKRTPNYSNYCDDGFYDLRGLTP